MDDFEHARKKLSEIQLAKVQGQKFLESLEVCFGRYNDFGLMLIFLLRELEKRKKQAEKRVSILRQKNKNKERPLVEPEEQDKNVIMEEQ